MNAPALALEQLLLDRRYPELVERLRAVLPVGLVDQADAATDETRTIAAALGSLMGASGGPQPVDTEDVPGWLRLGLLSAWADFALGRATTCTHDPDPRAPRPVFAAAWKPGLVVCGQCVHLFRLRRHGVADQTCDGCGRRCGGVEVGDGIWPALIVLGSLTYQYGVCDDCRPPNAPPPAIPRQRSETGPLYGPLSQDLGRPRGTGSIRPARGNRGRGKGGQR